MLKAALVLVAVTSLIALLSIAPTVLALAQTANP